MVEEIGLLVEYHRPSVSKMTNFLTIETALGGFCSYTVREAVRCYDCTRSVVSSGFQFTLGSIGFEIPYH